jgi:hypothetical protein
MSSLCPTLLHCLKFLSETTVPVNIKPAFGLTFFSGTHIRVEIRKLERFDGAENRRVKKAPVRVADVQHFSEGKE